MFQGVSGVSTNGRPMVSAPCLCLKVTLPACTAFLQMPYNVFRSLLEEKAALRKAEWGLMFWKVSKSNKTLQGWVSPLVFLNQGGWMCYRPIRNFATNAQILIYSHFLCFLKHEWGFLSLSPSINCSWSEGACSVSKSWPPGSNKKPLWTQKWRQIND